MGIPHPQMAKRIKAIEHDLPRLSHAVAKAIAATIHDDLLDEKLIDKERFYNMPFSVFFGNRSRDFTITIGRKPGDKKVIQMPGLRQRLAEGVKACGSAAFKGQNFGIIQKADGKVLPKPPKK